MKLKNLLLGITLFLFAGLASADNCFTGPCEKADLPTCGAKLKGREFMVKNCVSVSSCATTASPGFAVKQVCDYSGSAWAYRNLVSADAADVSAYVPITKAGQQTWTSTGAGNDTTETSADDIFKVLPAGGNFSVDGGAAGASGYDFDLEANGMKLYGYDATRTTYIAFLSSGADIQLPAGTYIDFQVGSGIELEIDDNVLILGTTTVIIPAAGSAPPVACSADFKGAYYFDDELLENCTCNGTNWKKNSDATTTCS